MTRFPTKPCIRDCSEAHRFTSASVRVIPAFVCATMASADAICAFATSTPFFACSNSASATTTSDFFCSASSASSGTLSSARIWFSATVSPMSTWTLLTYPGIFAISGAVSKA